MGMRENKMSKVSKKIKGTSDKMYNENVGTDEREMSIEDARDLGVNPELDDNYNRIDE